MNMSVTKTVQIGRPAADSYAFIAAPETMPQWAIHNVKAIREAGRRSMMDDEFATLEACIESK